MTCTDNAWLDDRIAKTRELIEAYENAILAISTGSISYTLDTGQTKQTVTKASLGEIRSALAALENRLAMLCARRNPGSTSFYGRPGF